MAPKSTLEDAGLRPVLIEHAAVGSPARAASVVAAVHTLGATCRSKFTTRSVAAEPVAAERAPRTTFAESAGHLSGGTARLQAKGGIDAIISGGALRTCTRIGKAGLRRVSGLAQVILTATLADIQVAEALHAEPNVLTGAARAGGATLGCACALPLRITLKAVRTGDTLIAGATEFVGVDAPALALVVADRAGWTLDTKHPAEAAELVGVPLLTEAWISRSVVAASGAIVGVALAAALITAVQRIAGHAAGAARAAFAIGVAILAFIILVTAATATRPTRRTATPVGAADVEAIIILEATAVGTGLSGAGGIVAAFPGLVAAELIRPARVAGLPACAAGVIRVAALAEAIVVAAAIRAGLRRAATPAGLLVTLAAGRARSAGSLVAASVWSALSATAIWDAALPHAIALVGRGLAAAAGAAAAGSALTVDPCALAGRLGAELVKAVVATTVIVLLAGVPNRGAGPGAAESSTAFATFSALPFPFAFAIVLALAWAMAAAPPAPLALTLRDSFIEHTEQPAQSDTGQDPNQPAA